MNQIKATELVEKEVMAEKPDCSLLTDSTEEFSSCFVFYFQSTKYTESGDLGDMYVGQGPVIVCKTTGRIFETGSAHSTQHYVNAFQSCGDPFGEPTSKILIYEGLEAASSADAAICIKKMTELGLGDAKSKMESVLKNENVVVELNSLEQVKSTISSLKEHGFKSRQLWSNEC